MSKKFLIYLFFLTLFYNAAIAEIIKSIKITGNQRVSNETIKLFSNVQIGNNYSEIDLNVILNELYETNFFENINLELKNNILLIDVNENPVIQTLSITGIKADKLKEPIYDLITLREKSSFINSKVKKDEVSIINFLKNSGHYFAKVESSYINIGNNLIELNYDIKLGDKAKIKKIKFLGNKYYKEAKLRNIILSDEYKFWKIISGKKFLNENLINFDKKLLTNFYKNNGFYQAKILPSFAKYIGDSNFELIYNINSGEKFYFNNFNLILPDDYDASDFITINKHFKKLKNKPYSFNEIETILNQIDLIASKNRYEFIDAIVNEEVVDNNKINFIFKIKESQKIYVEKINIIGNNVTRENVIRNNLIVDEGDAFNKILQNKSINQLKSLNFFKSVNYKATEGSSPDKTIIDINIEEKATGEITAGAGVGTSGGTIAFGIRENNYLGKGIGLNTNLTLSAESIKGIFAIKNPNYNGSNKSLNFRVESSENDRLKDFGYKSNKTGISLGSGFEYYENLNLNLGIDTFYEQLTTDSTASANLQKQKGNYFDTGINYTFDYDLRNQKFQTTDGYRSRFTQKVPLINERKTLENIYQFDAYKEVFKDTVTKLSFYTSASNSLSGDNIKLSERNFIPSSKLRGFEPGKVGPKDGDDYIGGNYNYSATIANSLTPYFLPNIQSLDFSVFFDIANTWGVDYDDSLNESNKIRSSTGLAIDWFTPIGPLNFSISEVISSAKTDKKEFFRFNLGTTF